RERIVMFGGYANGDCGEGQGALCRDTWEMDNGASDKPGHVMRVRYGASGESSATVSIQSVEARFLAGGQSHPATSCSSAVNGAQVHVWDEGRWKSSVANHINGAGYSAPAQASWSTQTDPELAALTSSAL